MGSEVFTILTHLHWSTCVNVTVKVYCLIEILIYGAHCKVAIQIQMLCLNCFSVFFFRFASFLLILNIKHTFLLAAIFG